MLWWITNQGHKSKNASKIILDVILDLGLVQMIALLTRDVKPLTVSEAPNDYFL